MRKFNKRIAAVGLPLATVAIAGIAFAAWTSSGTGSGYVASGQDTPVSTVSATASSTSKLYPNGSANVRLTIKNDNPYRVEVTAINNGVGSILSGNATCDTTNGVTYTNTSGSWVVPASGTLNVELTNKASMSNASVDACQNQTFTIPVALTAASTTLAASTNAF